MFQREHIRYSKVPTDLDCIVRGYDLATNDTTVCTTIGVKDGVYYVLASRTIQHNPVVVEGSVVVQQLPERAGGHEG